MPNGNTTGRSTKHVPNSPWFANAMRSMGMSSLTVLQSMTPTSYSIGKGSTNVIKTSAATMKQYTAGTKSMTKAIKANPYVKMGDSYFKNALSDLKSGKFVNPEREQEATDKLLSDTFGDMDDLFNFDDLDLDGDSNVDIEVNNNISLNTSIDRSADIITGAIAMQTEYQVKTAKASNDSVMATVIGVGSNLNAMGGNILSSLTAINDNLSALVTYQSENMTKFIEASIKYYDEHSTPEEVYKVDDKFNPGTVFTDGFSIENYMKSITTNIAKTYKDSTVGYISEFMLEMSDVITAQPLEFVTQSIIKNAMPKVLEKSMKKFDDTLTEFIPTLLNRIADMSDSSDPIRSAIGKIFGVKDKYKGQINLGKSLEDNAAVPFDKITKHTIVDLIPTYMRKMISIMEGTPEMYYDRSTGRHVKLDTIKDNIYDTINDSVKSPFISGKFDNKMSSRGDKLIGPDKAEYDALLSNFYTSLEKTNKEFNPIQQGVDSALAGIFGSDTNGKVKVSGVSDEIMNYFKAAINASSPEEIMGLSRSRLSATTQKNNMIKMYEDNASEFNLHALSYDSPAISEELNKRYSPSAMLGKAGTKNEKNLPKSLLQSTLEDIRMILNRGIDVSVIKGGPFSTANKNRNKKATSTSTVDNTDPILSQEEIESRLYSNQYVSSIKGNSEFSDSKIVSLSQQMRDQDADSNIDAILGSDVYDNGKGVMGPVRKALTPLGSQLASGVDKGRGLLINFLYGSPEQIMYEFAEKFIGFAEIAKDEFDKHVWSPMKSSLFGTKGVEGFRDGGVFGGLSNSIKDVYLSFGHTMTGKGFTNSKGEAIGDETDPKNTVWGNLRSTFSMLKDNTMSYIFGFKKDKNADGEPKEKVGIVDTALKSIAGGFKHFGSLFFGDIDSEDDDKVKKDTVEEMKAMIKKKAPKTIAGGMLGAVGGSFMGGSILGTLIGGPVFGSVLGSTIGWATQSEKFNNFMFGEMDEDSKERAGGLINKDIQKMFASSKTDIIGGAVLGTAKGLLFPGAGILSTIVGGPIAGAMMGTGLALLKKTEGFQNFMYGSGEPGDANYKKGIVNIFKGFAKNDDNQNRLGIAAVGAGGGAAISAVVGQMGIMGAMLTPFGPLGGAIAGAALGIATSSDKFRKYLFGDKDEEGKREGGALSKIEEFMKLEVFQPLRDNISEIGLNVKWFFKEKIADKISDAVGPFTYQIQQTAEAIKVKVVDTFTNIKDSVHSTIIKPFAENMELHFFRPLKNFMGKMFGSFGKILGSIVSAPFSLIASIGQSFNKDHKKDVLNDASNSAFKDKFSKNGEDDKRNVLTRLWQGGKASASVYTSENNRQKAYDESGTYLSGYDKSIKERNDKQKIEKASQYADMARQKDTSKLEQALGRVNRYKSLIQPGNLKSKKRYEKELYEYKKLKSRYIRRYGGLPENFDENITTAIGSTSRTAGDISTGSESSKTTTATGERSSATSPINTETVTLVNDGSSSVSKPMNIIRDVINGKSTSGDSSTTVSDIATVINNIVDPESDTNKKARAKKKDNVTKIDTNKEIKDTSKHVKDIRDEVKGQLNGVGSNISKIRRMLAKSLGYSDKGDTSDKGNKEEVTFGDRILNLLDTPFRSVGKMFGKGYSAVTGVYGKAKDTVGSIVATIQNIPNAIMGGLSYIGKGIMSGIGNIGKGLFGLVKSGLGLIGNTIKATGSIIGNTIKGAVTAAGTIIGQTVGAIGRIAASISTGLFKMIDHIPQAIENTFKLVGAIGSSLLNGFTGLTKSLFSVVSAGLSVTKEIAVTGIEVIRKAATSLVDIVAAPFKLVGKGLGWLSEKMFGAKDKSTIIQGGWLESIKLPVRINPGTKPIEVIIVDSKKVLDTKDVNGITSGNNSSNGILRSILATVTGIGAGLGISAGLQHLSGGAGLADNIATAGLTIDPSGKRTVIRRKNSDSPERESAKVELRGLTAKNIKAKKQAEAEKVQDVSRDIERNDELKSIRLLTDRHSKNWTSIFGKTGLLTLGALFIFKKIKDVLDGGLFGVLPIPDFNGDNSNSTDGMNPIELVSEQVSDLKDLMTSGNLKNWIAPDTDGNALTIETNHMSGVKTKGLINSGRVWQATKTGLSKLRNIGAELAKDTKAGKVISIVANNTDGFIKNAMGSIKKVTSKSARAEYKAAAKVAFSKEAETAKKVISMYNQFVDNVVSTISKKTGKLISRSNLDEKLIGKMFVAIQSNYHLIAPKIAAVLGQTGALLTSGIGFITKEATWVTLGAINGASGASRLFGVDSKYVTPGMVLISTIMGGAYGTTVGIIVDIVNELIVEVMQIDPSRMMAMLLYALIQGDTDKVVSAQQEFKSQYDSYVESRFKEATSIYNSEHGTDLTVDQIKGKASSGEITVHRDSFADYNHKQHKTIGSALTDTWNNLVKGEFSEISKRDVSTSKINDSLGINENSIKKAVDVNTSAKLGLLDPNGKVIPMSSYDKFDYSTNNSLYTEQKKMNSSMTKFYGKLGAKTTNYVNTKNKDMGNFDSYMDAHMNNMYGIESNEKFLSKPKTNSSVSSVAKAIMTPPAMSRADFAGSGPEDFGAGESGNNAANNSVYYNQTDSRWNGTPLGDSTIGKIGCIVSSLAMGLSSLANKAITPNTIMSKYGKTGFESNGSIRWDNVLGKSTADNGLSYGPVIPKNGTTKLKDYLSRRIPVLMFGKKSTTSTSNIYGAKDGLGDNHAVLALGLDANGKIVYNDPANKTKTNEMGKYAADLNTSAAQSKRMVPLMTKSGGGLSGMPTNAINGLGGDNVISENTNKKQQRTYSSMFDWLGDILTEGSNRIFDSVMSGTKVNTDYSNFKYIKDGELVDSSDSSIMLGEDGVTLPASASLKEELAHKLFSMTSSSESRGDYSTVVANDNGAYSVGLFQFHTGEANAMFNSLANKLTDPTLKSEALRYATMSNRALSIGEASKMKAFLSNPKVAAISKSVQDNQGLSRTYRNMSVPWDMYNSGKLMDPRSVIIAGDMANTGNHLSSWNSKYKKASSVTSELAHVRDSLKSSDSYWGAATGSKYYRGWLNRIDNSYKSVSGWNPTHTSTGDIGSGPAEDDNMVDIIKSSFMDYGSGPSESTADRSVLPESFYSIPTNDSKYISKNTGFVSKYNLYNNTSSSNAGSDNIERLLYNMIEVLTDISGYTSLSSERLKDIKSTSTVITPGNKTIVMNNSKGQQSSPSSKKSRTEVMARSIAKGTI